MDLCLDKVVIKREMTFPSYSAPVSIAASLSDDVSESVHKYVQKLEGEGDAKVKVCL